MPVYFVRQTKSILIFFVKKYTYILDKYCFNLEKRQNLFMQICIVPITTPVTCPEFTVNHSILGLFAL